MNRHARRRLSRAVLANPSNSFRSRWRNLHDRLVGKNKAAGEIFVEPIDEHLAAVVVLVHMDCLDHLSIHLMQAADKWIDGAA